MTNLNKLIILLIPLFIFSCKNASYNEYISDKEFFKTANSTTQKSISQYNYDFNYSASEKFEINNNLLESSIFHKNLPIPSVLKVYNPKNLKEFLIVRNVFTDSLSQKTEISNYVYENLGLDSSIFIEYLQNESKNLKSVELSKEKSVVQLDNNEILTEEILDSPSEVSEKMEINTKKLNKMASSDGSYFIFVDKYLEYKDARIETNKIRNLNLTISSENGSFEVLAGPFPTYDVDETLSFLLNNGFNNAKIYR